MPLVTLLVSAALIAPAATADAAATALRRYPYTNEVVGTTATVSWATDRSQSTGTATWGPVADGQCTPTHTVSAARVSITVGSTSEYQWTAVLPFGAAGTYCYRVQLGATDLLGADASPQVATAAAPGTPFSFAVVGDWGAGTSAEAAVMSRIGQSPASFVVTTGDNVYNSGTETEYGDLTQGNVFPPQYLPTVGSRPFFAAEGNHGFSTNLPYLQDLPAPVATQTSGGRYRQESYCCISTLSGTKTYPSSWYAFDWGSTRFYVLEAAWADTQGGYQGDFLAHWNGPVSGCGPCGAELAWLKSDLAAHPGQLKFAFFHYPMYSDSGSQVSDTYLSGASHLEGLLASNNVGIVFNGHAHLYERNYPQIAGQPLVSYVTGGGGDAIGSVGSCSAFDAYAVGSKSSCRAPKPASAANVYHFLLVTVNGTQVTVTPTDSTGRTFDVQTYTFPGVDGSPPDTVIDSAPAAQTNLTTAEVSFHATQSGATFACRLDGGPTTACTSPVSYGGLAEGPHQFAVQATTSSGTDTTPAVAGWTIDTTAPSAPANLTAAAPTPSAANLSWTAATDTNGIAGYDISRNGTPLATVSGTATAYTDSTVVAGATYQYQVTARDPAGNVSSPSNLASVAVPAVADDFSLTATPASVAVTAGQSTTTTVATTVTSGATQTVVLSASGLPAGATASFTPSTVSSGQSSTLTISTSATTPTGSASVTVTGTGTSTTHVVTVSLTVNPASSTSPRLVQSSGATETSASTSLTAVLPAPSAAGNLLVLSASVYTGLTNQITSVTDTAGNTWLRAGAYAVSGHYSDGEMWYSPNAAPAGAVTVHTASSAVIALTVQEFSGIARSNPLDCVAGTSASSTAASSGPVTPSVGNDLVVGFIAGHGNQQAITVTAPGFTAQPQQSSVASSVATVVSAYQVRGDPTTQTLTGGFASTMYWAAGIACFRSA